MNINDAPRQAHDPLFVRNVVAELSLEERRLMMRHYRRGGNVQADVAAHKLNEQKILEKKIRELTQRLKSDQQILQSLIGELNDDIEADNPFEEYKLQNVALKESIETAGNFALGLEDRMNNTKLDLLSEKQKRNSFVRSIQEYTEQVEKAKKQSSKMEAAIENVSTLSNCVI
ncbi:MAG: hypothetical protein H0W50_06435, partial [Parachlamydiaceae bacterium]|nr:hypothetical protein [Parachlamydiaceae bacterium]